MKNRLMLTGLLAALVALLAAFATPDATVRPQDDDDTQLALYMKDINTGLKSLRGMVADKDRYGEAIEVVRGVQVLCTKARAEKPAMAAEVAEGDRAAFVVDYQVKMIEFAKSVMDLELALLHGDAEAVVAAYKNVGGMKKPAHQKFKG